MLLLVSGDMTSISTKNLQVIDTSDDGVQFSFSNPNGFPVNNMAVMLTKPLTLNGATLTLNNTMLAVDKKWSHPATAPSALMSGTTYQGKDFHVYTSDPTAIVWTSSYTIQTRMKMGC